MGLKMDGSLEHAASETFCDPFKTCEGEALLTGFTVKNPYNSQFHPSEQLDVPHGYHFSTLHICISIPHESYLSDLSDAIRLSTSTTRIDTIQRSDVSSRPRHIHEFLYHTRQTNQTSQTPITYTHPKHT